MLVIRRNEIQLGRTTHRHEMVESHSTKRLYNGGLLIAVSAGQERNLYILGLRLQRNPAELTSIRINCQQTLASNELRICSSPFSLPTSLPFLLLLLYNAYPINPTTPPTTKSGICVAIATPPFVLELVTLALPPPAEVADVDVIVVDTGISPV